MAGHRHLLLTPHEAAFLLQRHEDVTDQGRTASSETRIRALMRRGERLSEKGLTVQEILEAPNPAIPTIRNGGGRRRIPARVVMEMVAGDDLARLFVEAAISGEFTCPRAASPEESVPTFHSQIKVLQ
jgi:hypothetical protein